MISKHLSFIEFLVREREIERDLRPRRSKNPYGIKIYFWHRIECFALSGLSVHQIVRYQHIRENGNTYSIE